MTAVPHALGQIVYRSVVRPQAAVAAVRVRIAMCSVLRNRPVLTSAVARTVIFDATVITATLTVRMALGVSLIAVMPRAVMYVAVHRGAVCSAATCSRVPAGSIVKAAVSGALNKTELVWRIKGLLR